MGSSSSINKTGGADNINKTGNSQQIEKQDNRKYAFVNIKPPTVKPNRLGIKNKIKVYPLDSKS